jgi:hypothetical protein
LGDTGRDRGDANRKGDDIMSFDLIDLKTGHVRHFDTLGTALGKAERRSLTSYQLWEIDRHGNRALRLQVGSSST